MPHATARRGRRLAAASGPCGPPAPRPVRPVHHRSRAGHAVASRRGTQPEDVSRGRRRGRGARRDAHAPAGVPPRPPHGGTSVVAEIHAVPLPPADGGRPRSSRRARPAPGRPTLTPSSADGCAGNWRGCRARRRVPRIREGGHLVLRAPAREVLRLSLACAAEDVPAAVWHRAQSPARRSTSGCASLGRGRAVIWNARVAPPARGRRRSGRRASGRRARSPRRSAAGRAFDLQWYHAADERSRNV
jgi:hypothetical protein